MLNNQHPTVRIDRASGSPSPTTSDENGPDLRSHKEPIVSGSQPAPMGIQHARATSDFALRDSLSQDGIAQVPRDATANMPLPPTQLPARAGQRNEQLSLPEELDKSLTIKGASSTSTDPTSESRLEASQALPVRTVSLSATASLSTTPGASPSSPRPPKSLGELSRSLSDRRDLAPRLATLPPPMMASFTAKGSARLTPSVGPRQPPMPILNLPTLPPMTPSQNPTRPRQQAPLRSIPALPMRGPSESEREADHENGILDEEEEEEEGEEYADASPGVRETDGGASDEEDTEDTSYTASSPATPRSRGDRPAGMQDGSSRMTAGAEQNRETIYFTPQAAALPTAAARRPGSSSSAATDYFTSKRADRDIDRSHSPSRTPRPADYFANPSLRTLVPGNGPQLVPMPAGSSRPGLYQLGSRSMIDLLSPSSKRAKDKMATPSIGPETTAERRRSKALPGPPTIDEDPQGAVPDDSTPASPTLRRQRSLPIYKISSDPPPYPSFHPRGGGPAIQPRDEEGKERLPSYSNSIYLTAVMPRKMEFIAPGVQARDRKWRRVLCVLEGTAFSVYKCPPGASGVSAIEEWWERKVGVGDITVTGGTAVTQSGIRVSAVRGRVPDGDRPGKTEEDPTPPADAPETESNPPPAAPPPTRSKLHIAAVTLLHPSRAAHSHKHGQSNGAQSVTSPTSRLTNPSVSRSRPSVDTQPPDDHSTISIVARSSMDDRSSRNSAHHSTSNSRSTSVSSPPASDSSSSFFSRSRILPSSSSSATSDSPPGSAKTAPEPSPKDLIKGYTLQNAESGLASDYSKRKNVIRVRMEGEQFLLQAQDVASVIDWIEVRCRCGADSVL